MKYIVVIDEGTSSTRATVYDENANAVCMRQKGLNFQYPQPGWVECSAVEIWESTREVLYDAVTSSGVPLKDILSIGMTAQRESVVVWDRATGEPVYLAGPPHQCLLSGTEQRPEECGKSPQQVWSVHNLLFSAD